MIRKNFFAAYGLVLSAKPLASMGLLASVGLLAMAGCETIHEETRGDITRHPFDPESMSVYYGPMIQKAAAKEMSITDGHFEPHTSELSPLGAHRLEQLRRELEQFGGRVRYHTQLTDEDMVADRLGSAREYLMATGLDMTNVTVDAGFAGGSAMTAVQAKKAMDAMEQTDFGGAGVGVSATGSGQ